MKHTLNFKEKKVYKVCSQIIVELEKQSMTERHIENQRKHLQALRHYVGAQSLQPTSMLQNQMGPCPLAYLLVILGACSLQ